MEKKSEYLETSLSNIHKLNRLVHELFELSKLEAHQIEPQLELLSITELVQDVAMKYKPEAEIVGSDFPPLFNKDFAPYLEKIRASGAEVVVSSNWATDMENLIKQSRQLGMEIPLAGPFFDDYRPLEVIGGPKGRGMIVVFYHLACISTPENNRFNEIWHEQWKTWKQPYDSNLYRWPSGVIGGTVAQFYWLFDVIQKAGSTDPEKIIQAWEGHEFESFTGTMKMRACDHQAIRDIYVSELDFPTKWQEDCASYGQCVVVPAKFCMPSIAEDMKDRCE